MHRSRLAQWVIDCRQANADPVELDLAARFWAAAMGRDWRRLPDPADAHYRQLDMPDGQPGILLQAVRHPSRAHWTSSRPTWRRKSGGSSRWARGGWRRYAAGG